MRHINQLDLFSGIGGFHLGFERAGYQVKSFFSEIDKHAVAVYKQKFKNSTYVGSVTDVRGAELPTIDLITFGSPCQDFSLAGKRKGMEGERSSLILEAIRLIHECRPRVFIWENVKGTFSSNNGADFWAIVQAFANIGGYRLEWQLCNTKWFLPQNRERIYLVGYSTIPRGDWRGVFPIERQTRNNTYQDIKEKQILLGYSRCNITGDVLNYHRKDVANTIHSSSGHGGNTDQFIKVNGVKDQSYRIRKLTPIECERLQGFPYNHTEYGNYDGVIKKMSNTQRYKQCGNAVTVDVVQAIAEQLKTIFDAE